MTLGADAAQPQWRFAFASEIGTSHINVGLPCQDASACETVRDSSGGDVLVVVVSDGAGSAPRAEEGSRFACDHFVRVTADWLRSNTATALTADEMARWLQEFQTRIEDIARASSTQSRDFACTLLLAVLGPHSSAYMQIGDGAIVVRSPLAESYDVVFWPQKGEYENTTNFATDPASFEMRHCEVLPLPIDEIAVFSDGIQAMVLHYATQTAHSAYFKQMISAVRRHPEAGKAQTLCDALRTYLGSESVNSRTDDDKSLVLATRLSVAPGPPRVAPA
jgi:hypothetical protein